jgi:hypothetical protein
MRFAVILMAAACLLMSCSDDNGNGGGSFEPNFWIGTNYSPENWPDDSETPDVIWYFEAHHIRNGSHGNLIGYHGNWRKPATGSGNPTELKQLAQLAKEQFRAEPSLGFGWWDVNDGPDLTSTTEPSNNTWTNAQTRDEFRNLVADYCEDLQPRFVFMGNETNSWWLTLEADPTDQAQQWSDWVSQFTETYDAIKAVSPDTIVFTVFQLEQMAGIGQNSGWDNITPHWHLLSSFGDKIDAIGFTTYPHVEYNNPADVPDTYYDMIEANWDGPIIFTEISWPANPASPPYTGNQQMQSDWIERFFTITAGMDILYANHAFLHDPPDGILDVAFDDAGLRSNDGTVVRMADATWQDMVEQLR